MKDENEARSNGSREREEKRTRAEEVSARRNIRSWAGLDDNLKGSDKDAAAFGDKMRRQSGRFTSSKSDFEVDDGMEPPPLFSAEAALNYVAAAILLVIFTYTVLATFEVTAATFVLAIEFGAVAVVLLFFFIYVDL